MIQAGKPVRWSQPKIGDSGVPADLGEISLVEVAEWDDFFAAQPALDRLGYIAAGLNGGLGQAGERLAGWVIEMGEVADHENFGMAWDGEVRLNKDAACSIDGAAGFFGESTAQRRAENAGGPENRGCESPRFLRSRES